MELDPALAQDPIPSSPRHRHRASRSPSDQSPPPSRRSPPAPDAPAPAAAADAKKPRACEACRGLKVRCDWLADAATDADAPCKRCRKAGRRCVVTAPVRRRQRKNDGKVAELEKRIDALTASLVARSGYDNVGGDGSVLDGAASARYDRHRSPEPRRSPASASRVATSWGVGIHVATPASTTEGSLSTPPVTDGVTPNYERALPSSGPGSAREATAAAGTWAGTKRKMTDRDNEDGHSTHHASSHREQGRPAPSAGLPSFPAAFPESSFPARPQLAPPPPPPLAPPPAPQRTPASPTPEQREFADVVDRGVLSLEEASRLLRKYNQELVPIAPLVVLPPDTTVASLRRDKPVLFLSIMAAAANGLEDVQGALVREMTRQFAERIVVVGEKSLDLICALLVAVCWYWSPDQFEELKFYQLMHMAAVMAIDLGMGRSGMPSGGFQGRPGRMPGFGAVPTVATAVAAVDGMRQAPASGAMPMPPAHHLRRRMLPDPRSVESRRTWLACYFLTSNAAMSLHRPNLVQWTPFMAESLEVLRTSPDAAPTDAYFCHFVQSHQISEEVATQFATQDPNVKMKLSEMRTQHVLKSLEMRFESCVNAIPKDMMQAPLRLGLGYVKLYMYETALISDNAAWAEAIASRGNEPGGGGPPMSTADKVHGENAAHGCPSSSDTFINPNLTLTPYHVSAVSACISAIDEIFTTFTTMDIDMARLLPAFAFVRVTYGMTVLIKLYLAAVLPGSQIGMVLSAAAGSMKGAAGGVEGAESLMVDVRLNKLIDRFMLLNTNGLCRPAGKFMIVLLMLRGWFSKQVRVGGPGGPDGPSRDGLDGSGTCPSLQADRGECPPPPTLEDLCTNLDECSHAHRQHLQQHQRQHSHHHHHPHPPSSRTHSRAPAPSYTAAPPDPTTPSHAPPHMPPAGIDYPTTPLHLLSEVATGDSARHAARPGSVPALPPLQSHLHAPPWFRAFSPQPQPHAWPRSSASAATPPALSVAAMVGPGPLPPASTATTTTTTTAAAAPAAAAAPTTTTHGGPTGFDGFDFDALTAGLGIGVLPGDMDFGAMQIEGGPDMWMSAMGWGS